MTDVMAYNGGSVVAMCGKRCVAIASDKRLGSEGLTISNNREKIYRASDMTLLGVAGLATDAQTLFEALRHKTNIRELKRGRPITPSAYASLVSSTLYEKRFSPYYVEPVVAGLEAKDGRLCPFVCATDLIGCISNSGEFAVSGTAATELYGMCEALYAPDLEPEDLFETVAQCLMSAVDRDAASGMGAVVYLLTEDRLAVRTLKTRQD
ncbi:MAG: 20S proteasome subunit beta 3, PSMB3 [Amphiamblys sp. WSBS2006]|nr:MAG: 20S proteasome subunit beta 3, PSMB3 [Amphiamblys sp. WSBS2006]